MSWWGWWLHSYYYRTTGCSDLGSDRLCVPSSANHMDCCRFITSNTRTTPPYIVRISYELFLELFFILTCWSIYGIVCLTGLFLLTPLTHLKRDWINSGTIKMFMTSEHSCREPEVGSCMSNFSKKNCKVVTWCGHRGLIRPALKLSTSTVYVYVLTAAVILSL